MVQHPTMIEIGTLSLYFTYEELMDIRKALNYFSGDRLSLDDYDSLKFYLDSKIREYERRMKDAK